MPLQPGPVDEPVEEPVVEPVDTVVGPVDTGVCGDSGAPVGDFTTNLCAGNIANPSQEQIDALAKGCGH